MKIIQSMHKQLKITKRFCTACLYQSGYRSWLGQRRTKFLLMVSKMLLLYQWKNSKGTARRFLHTTYSSFRCHLLETRYGRDTAKQILQQKPEVIEDEKAEKNKQKWEHSSANFYSNSTDTTANATPPPALSPLGECCLARHLANDYRMIKTMLQEPHEIDHDGVLKPLDDVHPALRDACSWGTSKEQQELCRDDIKSMIMRRIRYFDQSMGTCSKIVSD